MRSGGGLLSRIRDQSKVRQFFLAHDPAGRAERNFHTLEVGGVTVFEITASSYAGCTAGAGVGPYPILKAAALPRIRFHDLRDSAATLLLAQGVHPRFIMELFGYSSIRLTMNTYGHVLEEMKHETARTMDDALNRVAVKLAVKFGDCESDLIAKAFRIWRARRDSNPRPTGSKPAALSKLSYGRAPERFYREQTSSRWPIGLGISSRMRRFAKCPYNDGRLPRNLREYLN